MVLNYKVFETRQEAESFLNKKEIDLKDETYLEIRKVCEKTPALLGVCTKLVFNKKIDLESLKSFLEILTSMTNELKRDKESVQNILVSALKANNSSEHIQDTIDRVRLKTDVYKFINSLQYSEVRKELKDNHYDEIEAGIISIKTKEDWEEELKFISSKSARFKQASDALSTFKRLIKNVVGGFSPESIAKRIKETPGSLIVYNRHGFVVAQVFTREASCNLGSSSWCISGSYGNYFQNYADPSKGRQQYFVWNTNLEPTHNESLVGITIEENGRLNTAHYKNDSHFGSVKNYYQTLVKKGELDQEFISTIFDALKNKKNRKVKLYYALYGKNELKTNDFKLLFQEEWNNSDKNDIDSFFILYDLFMVFIKNRRDLQYHRLKRDRRFVQILRLFEKLVGLATKFDVSKILEFFVRNENLHYYNNENTYALIVLENCLAKQELDPYNLIEILYEISKNQNSSYSAVTIYHKDIDLKFDSKSSDNKLILDDSNFDIIEKINSIKRIELVEGDITFNYNKTEFDEIYISSTKKTTDVSKILPETGLSCYRLVIENNSSYKTYKGIEELIEVRDEILIKNTTLREKAFIHIRNTIQKNELKSIGFINCDVDALSEGKYTISKIKNVHIYKSNFLADISKIFNKMNILKIEYSLISTDLRDVNSKNIQVTSDVIYNQDNYSEILKQDNIKVLGGIELNERMESMLLSKLYKKFDDKDRYKKFLSMLGNNGIDIKNVKDKSVKYLPSVAIKYNKLPKDKDFITIGISEEEGFKYFLYYIKGSVKNVGNPKKGRNVTKTIGSRGDRKLYFIDDKLNSVNKTEANNREIEDQYNFIASRIPSYKDLVEETDYVITIDVLDVINSSRKLKGERSDNRKGSLVFKSEEELKGDFIQRYKNYIKDRYVFNVNGEKETINYINTLLTKITTLNNTWILKQEVEQFFHNIEVFLEKGKQEKNINGFASSNIQRSSLDYKPMISNYYFLSDLGDKIYPDADKLNTLLTSIENVQRLIKKGLRKTRVEIEFMKDFEILTGRYNYFIKFLDNMITNSNIPFLFALNQNSLIAVVNSILNNGKYYPSREASKQVRLDNMKSLLRNYYIRKQHDNSAYHNIIELKSGIRSRSKLKQILNEFVDSQIDYLDEFDRKLKIFFDIK